MPIDQADNMETEDLIALLKKKQEAEKEDPGNEARQHSTRIIHAVLKQRGVEVED